MRGKLTVYAGPMFSGKSAHLIRAISLASGRVLCLAPAFDNRSGHSIHSREGRSYPARSIACWPSDVGQFGMVVADEAHFQVSPHYRGDVVQDIISTRARGVDVVVGGLDTDYHRETFPVMQRLMAEADEVVMLEARCHVCGGPARWTAKKKETGCILETGDADLYEARCDAHWTLPE